MSSGGRQLTSSSYSFPRTSSTCLGVWLLRMSFAISCTAPQAPLRHGCDQPGFVKQLDAPTAHTLMKSSQSGSGTSCWDVNGYWATRHVSNISNALRRLRSEACRHHHCELRTLFQPGTAVSLPQPARILTWDIRLTSSSGTSTPSFWATCRISCSTPSVLGEAIRMHRHRLLTGSITCPCRQGAVAS